MIRLSVELEGSRESGRLKVEGKEFSYRFRPELLKNLNDERSKILFGKDVYHSLFQDGEIKRRVEDCISRHERVVVELISNNPELLSLPFELVYSDEQGFLCRGGALTFVRHLRGVLKVVKTKKVKKVKVLFLISLPLSVYRRAPLDPLEEVERIKRVLMPFIERGEVELYVEERARFSEVKKALEMEEWDVIHFTGHGAGEKGLVFEDNENPEEEKILGPTEIKELFINTSPSLIILDACETATTSSALPPLAAELYKLLPETAVIGTLATITDSAATSISEEIYREIFEKGRFSDLLTTSRLSGKGEWWKPALFCPPDALDLKIFEAEGGERRKRIFKVPEDLTYASEYVYRYEPVRETTEKLSHNGYVILHGIGGAGKSVLSRYVARFLEGRFENVLYYTLSPIAGTVLIDSPEKLAGEIIKDLQDTEIVSDEELKELEREVKKTKRSYPSFLGVSESETERRLKALKAVYSFLGKKLSRDTLLIIDDLESVAQDGNGLLLPEWRAAVETLLGKEVKFILTSRLVPLKDPRTQYSSVVEIGEYTLAEVAFLIRRLLYRGDTEKAKYLSSKLKEIQEKLGFHPLTLSLLLRLTPSQVESVVEDRETYEERFNFRFYREFLEKNRPAISLLLNLPEPFSEDFIVSVLGGELFSEFRSSLRLLKEDERSGGFYRFYRILRAYFGRDYPINPDEETVSLVRNVLKSYIENLEKPVEEWKKGLANAVSLALTFTELEEAKKLILKIPHEIYEAMSVFPEIFNYSLNLLEKFPEKLEPGEEKAKVEHILLELFRFKDTKKAEKFGLSAINSYDIALKQEENPDILNNRADAKLILSKVKLSKGNIKEAEELLKSAINDYNKAIKIDEIPGWLNNRANAKSILSEVKLSEGNIKEAEELLESAIDDYNRAIEVQVRPDILNNRANAKSRLSEVKLSKGNTKEAEEFLSGAYEDSYKAYRLTRESSPLYAAKQLAKALIFGQRAGIERSRVESLLCELLHVSGFLPEPAVLELIAYLRSEGFSPPESIETVEDPTCKAEFRKFKSLFLIAGMIFDSIKSEEGKEKDEEEI